MKNVNRVEHKSLIDYFYLYHYKTLYAQHQFLLQSFLDSYIYGWVFVGCSKSEPEACCEETILPNTPETVIDCTSSNAISTVGVDCPYPAPDYGVYEETIEGNLRNINTNTVPNHIYGDFRGRFEPVTRTLV